MAITPFNLTPVFSLFNSVRSKSLFLAVSRRYFSTSDQFVILDFNSSTNALSGAKTINVIPYIVSIQVVNILNEPPPVILNSTSTPVDLPIQLRCISFVDSGQSTSFKPSNNLSAYLGISITHCFIFLLTTGYPPLSDLPSIISSLDTTVPNSSHQFTGMSTSLANESLYNCLNIHCVHL